MRIRELRILPPLAIGRLGAARTPMDNYEALVDPENPLSARRLVPASTLQVDERTGEIRRRFVPRRLRFKERNKVRPVAPILEVWALVDRGKLVPLTTSLLRQNGLKPDDLRWSVHVGNHKIYRRTGDTQDRIDAKAGPFFDHSLHRLEGHCENFWPGKSLPFGTVRYFKPNEKFPEIRFRFTPAAGLVYGSSRRQPSKSRRPADRNIARVLYQARPLGTKGKHGRWLGYQEPNSPSLKVDELTHPAGIYASDRSGASLGYFDDECDGLVHVELVVGRKTLTADARIGAGPPAYAPDSFPIRTVADELEQALLGPTAKTSDVTFSKVEEIVRRAFETVRLMNTRAMNATLRAGDVTQGNNMARQDTQSDVGRFGEPIMEADLVDSGSLRALHQSILTALRSGAAPWFGDVLRDYNAIGDVSDKGRRKMPALMRGADGRYLTLTRRQVEMIRKAARGEIFRTSSKRSPTQSDGPEVVRSINAANLTAQLTHRGLGNPPSTKPTAAISNCFPGLEFDFRNVWHRILEGIELHEGDNRVVGVDANREELKKIQGQRLLYIDHWPTFVQVIGPNSSGGPNVPLPDLAGSGTAMEWSNALATVLYEKAGQKVPCWFTDGTPGSREPTFRKSRGHDLTPPRRLKRMPRGLISFDLTINRLFAKSAAGRQLAVISPELVGPGDLTRSLCSPWQNDYRECACYYWAASRPDYVNVEEVTLGQTEGNNWLAKKRTPKRYSPDTDNPNPELWGYDDLFRSWQEKLHFVIDGRDAE